MEHALSEEAHGRIKSLCVRAIHLSNNDNSRPLLAAIAMP